MSARIMVLDNDESMRALFDSFLADVGWDVFSSDYAHTNLAEVQRIQPALIILDINLAQAGTGWDFLQLLKLDDSTAAIPMLICTTATALSSEIEGYLAGKHIHIVRKPFDLNAFILIVQQILTAANAAAVPLALDISLPILVVEDDDLMRESLVIILRLEDYKVVTAANGLLALAAVTQAQFRLILLDIGMPVMDGLEFLAAYAKLPGPYSPVIVLSGQADNLDEVLPPFVIQVIAKPYEVSDLLTTISHYTHPV